jgi:hypothetical protein
VVVHWILTVEPGIDSRLNSSEIHGELCGTTAGFSVCFFGFPSLIMIPPLLHICLLLPLEVCDSPDQAAHYHILGFVSDPALGWLQSAEVYILMSLQWKQGTFSRAVAATRFLCQTFH